MGSLGNMENLLGSANSRAEQATPITRTRRTPQKRAAPQASEPAPAAAARPQPAPPAASGAAYLDYERIEARFTQEQLAQLDAIVRTLQSKKAKGHPRITRNTLLRVAADLLIERQGDLVGNTEDELRDSIL